MTADVNSISTRSCGKCGTADRYVSGICKTCAQANRVKYYANNKDKCKAYADAHKDAINEKRKEYRKARPEKRDYAARHLQNKESRNAYSKAWRLANPEAGRIHRQNRRAAQKASGGKLSQGLLDKLFVLQQGRCPCCRQPLGNDCELDHKMPIALGGTNSDENMQLLRKVCNKQKRSKHPVDFMQSRGFLL